MKKSPNRFPDFLIIGAMKSGTTSMFMDLCRHPQVYLSDTKEPHNLCDDHVLTEQGMEMYSELYKGANASQLICDASTGYSKLPDYPGVAARAKQLLPEDFKVIYMLRHPIERIISQFHHELQAGLVGQEINEVVRENPRYVNYSCYGFQLQPWIEAVGIQRILVVRFEDYKDNRQEVLENVCRFLGLPVEQLVSSSKKIYNKSVGKPIVDDFWKAIRRNWFYRRCIRPLVSLKFRLALKCLVLPKSNEVPTQLSEETKAWLASDLQEDLTLLELSIQAEEPLWPSLT